LSNELLSIYKILENWKDIVKALTDSTKKVLGDVEVVPFGSIVEGKATATSDLDILVIVKDLPRSALTRAQIISKIEEATGLPPIHPIQIHLTTWQEAETNPIYKEILVERLKNKRREE